MFPKMILPGTVVTAFGKAASEPTPFIGSSLRGVGTLHTHLPSIRDVLLISGHVPYSPLKVPMKAK